ncbi:MAG: hypothetical protein AAGG72_01140 [Pseudomonadota bacterium]
MSHWVGLAIVVVPLLIILRLFVRPPIWWFAVALCALGLGYLEVTGAAAEVGQAMLSLVAAAYEAAMALVAAPSNSSF